MLRRWDVFPFLCIDSLQSDSVTPYPELIHPSLLTLPSKYMQTLAYSPPYVLDTIGSHIDYCISWLVSLLPPLPSYSLFYRPQSEPLKTQVNHGNVNVIIVICYVTYFIDHFSSSLDSKYHLYIFLNFLFCIGVWQSNNVTML